MKYIDVGSPEYQIYVPKDRTPVILGTHESDMNESHQAIILHTRICYPEKTFLSPLMPKEVVKRFEEANSKVPGLDYE